MDFFFPEDNLQRTSPEDTKILSIKAEPYDDSRRVKISLEISPFEKRPHIDVVLSDSQDQEVSSSSFVEAMSWKLEFTMHLRQEPSPGPLKVEAHLYYPDGPTSTPESLQFDPSQN